MKHPRKPTTIQEADAEINIYSAEIFAIRQKIKELEELKKVLARPWERTRPVQERSLQAYGVTP